MYLFQWTQHHNETYGREGKKTNPYTTDIKRCPLKLIKHFAKHYLHLAIICRSNRQSSSERCQFNQSFRVYVVFFGGGLSGRVLDIRPKGRGFEPSWRHCVVILEHDTFILAYPRKTRPYITERLLMGRKELRKSNLYVGFKSVLHTRDYRPNQS